MSDSFVQVPEDGVGKKLATDLLADGSHAQEIKILDGVAGTRVFVSPATEGTSQAIRDRLGEVQASPTANTVLDRLKSVATGLVGLATNTMVQAVRDRLPTTLVAGRLDVNVGASATIPVSGTFWQATQPVSAASLPLPTGAASETTLSGMSGKLPATLGQKTSANSLSAVIASDQSSLPITQSTPTFATTAITWSAASSITLSAATRQASDALLLNDRDMALSITVQAVYAGTPTSGDLLNVRLSRNNGDVSGDATDDYDTIGQSKLLMTLDLYNAGTTEATAIKSVDLPRGGMKGLKLVIDAPAGATHNLTVRAIVRAQRI